MEEKWAFTNRLIHEKSPYLLQHAHNPVDWYPWGQEAFDAAKEQDKPIFLSIGYATCHWCHVMEEESFSDTEVAMIFNESFVCVKVDREELPEVDSLYMDFAQAMIIGSAGWPLNLFLTPDLKPFFATTYMPKRVFKGAMGLIDLAEKINQMWKDDEERSRLLSQSEKIFEVMQTHIHVQGMDIPASDLIAQTAETLFKIADPVWGGMKGAPKFPLGYQAIFLINYFLRSRDSRALFLVEKTLEMMHRGGIYDHLGGGFHRYSIDEQWHVPHFEKMLYDNALLASTYLYAWKVTKRDIYKEVCEEILQYLEQDMSSPGGGFYSAEDADTDGVEGLFYTWTRQEIETILGVEDGDFFCDFYDVYDPGTVDNRSVLVMTSSIGEFAAARQLPVEEVEKRLSEMRAKLFKERSKRIQPFKDDKILTSWNGLAINAFAQAGFILQNKEYMRIAKSAAQFIKEQMWKPPHLLRRYRDDEARFAASLDDYVFLIQSLITLFETGNGIGWLKLTVDLMRSLDENFKALNGAYYQSDDKVPGLIVRKAQFADGAEPSGNAVHAENLLRLYQITHERRYLAAAEDIFKAVYNYITVYPLGYCYELIALQRYYDENRYTIVIALDELRSGKDEISQVLAQRVFGHHSIVWREPSDKTQDLLLPYSKELQPVNNTTTLYLCKEGSCKEPVVGVDEIIRSLDAL